MNEILCLAKWTGMKHLLVHLIGYLAIQIPETAEIISRALRLW
jgi:hypothetical protein